MKSGEEVGLVTMNGTSKPVEEPVVVVAGKTLTLNQIQRDRITKIAAANWSTSSFRDHASTKFNPDLVDDIYKKELSVPSSLQRAMRDGSASAPSPSPFLLLTPKHELSGSPPRTAQPAKPKFEPKVKPRGGAKARPQQNAPVEVKGKQNASQVEVKGEQRAQTEVRVKGEEKEKKAEIEAVELKVEKNAEIEEVEVKGEPNEEMEVEVKGEDDYPQVEVKGEYDNPQVEVKGEEIGGKEESVGRDEGDEGQGGDRIVREIDVLLTPNVDGETQLYLLQYPLRPKWRPYGLEERCQEVRIKPQQSKFELDLVIDTESDNYDPDRESHLQITKQTLSSVKVPMSTSYAIGILRGNQLHLNPVQAVVQFRPSMKYIDDHDAIHKKSNKDAGITDGEDEEMVDAEPVDSKSELTLVQVNIRRRETERQEATRLQSHAYLKQLEEAEAWIPLEPHGTDSPVTEGIRQKMVASTTNRLTFDMSPGAYIDTLVPGRSSTSAVEVLREDGSGNTGISRRHLETLSLEDRYKEIFSKGRVQVIQFEALMKLAPKESSELDVLKVITLFASLVQGCWVAISDLRYKAPMTLFRDYILLLFSKSQVVKHEQLRGLPISKEQLREIMTPIAVQRGGVSWEFQEHDRSFIKKHQAVVKSQAQQWAESEEGIMEELLELNPAFNNPDGDEPMEIVVEEKRPNKKGDKQAQNAPAPTGTRPPSGRPQGSKALAATAGGDRKSGMENGESSGRVTMSEATRGALPFALREIFLKHHVCSLQIICQSLRDMAIEQTAANPNSKAAANAVAAAKGANAPPAELTAAVSKVATNLGGVYFLSSLGNPVLDPFREVVIALLRNNGPNTGLRRTEIMVASKIRLGTEPPAPTYNKVLKELCYTRGGAWVLKPGDGRPT